MKNEELLGELAAIKYTSPDATFIIATLVGGDIVIGNVKPGQLVPGLTYRWLGKWTESPKYGKQFRFQGFVCHTPQSRRGVVKYLQNAPGIGATIAHRLCDLYNADKAIGALKSNPRECARQIAHLSIEKAEKAAARLVELQEFEETKIELLELLEGRGFSAKMIDQVIKVFGVHAPSRIRHDPFCLMVRRMPSAGFQRCDRLYLDLGLPPQRLKRQVMCGHYAMRSGMRGSTWYAEKWLANEMRQSATGDVKAEKAIQLGIRAKWFSRHVDDEEVGWIAERRQADAEAGVAEILGELL